MKSSNDLAIKVSLSTASINICIALQSTLHRSNFDNILDVRSMLSGCPRYSRQSDEVIN